MFELDNVNDYFLNNSSHISITNNYLNKTFIEI